MNEATQEQHDILTTGVRLRNAREQFGLSQQAVAERLCLKVSTIRDIEADRAPADLALTFLRGYIRSYAKLVHISEEELLPMMEKQNETVRVSKIAPMQSFSRGKLSKKRDGWLFSFTWLVLFVVIGLTGAWWQSHQAQQEESITTAAQSTDSEPAAQSSDSAMSAPAEQAVFSPLQANVDTATAEPQTADNAKQLPAADLNALVMNFTADCWLEASDATGKKLFSGLQRKNGRLNLTGQAPYKFKIGAPAAVQIQYLGKPVDLSHFIRTNQVAHLTIDAEQSAAQ